jgi:hypothetical protein
VAFPLTLVMCGCVCQGVQVTSLHVCSPQAPTEKSIPSAAAMSGPGHSQKNPLFPQVDEDEDLPSTSLPDASSALGDTTRSHSPPSARDPTSSERGVRQPFSGSTVRAGNGAIEILVGTTRHGSTIRLSEDHQHNGTR